MCILDSHSGSNEEGDCKVGRPAGKHSDQASITRGRIKRRDFVMSHLRCKIIKSGDRACLGLH